MAEDRFEKSNVEKDKLEKYKVYTTASMAIIGMMIAIMLIFTQYRTREANSEAMIIRERLDILLQENLIRSKELEKQSKELEKQIWELKKEIEEIKKKSGKTSAQNTAFVLITNKKEPSIENKVQDQITQSPKRDEPIFKKYILPAIYGLLGLILLSSSLVTLSTKDNAKKETSLELTKTLMTFFIGAATGQV